MKSSPTGAVLQLLLVIPSLASASHFRRVAVLRGGADGGGSSGGLDIDSMLELAKSPEAAEELRRLTADPEAMREARELMDDPDFRRQVTEALAAGGGAKFEQIRETLSAESVSMRQPCRRELVLTPRPPRPNHCAGSDLASTQHAAFARRGDRRAAPEGGAW